MEDKIRERMEGSAKGWNSSVVGMKRCWFEKKSVSDVRLADGNEDSTLLDITVSSGQVSERSSNLKSICMFYGKKSLSGRRPESSSTDNHNIPHIEGEIPVPNLPNMLPLDGVPYGNSTFSSSSSSPCAAKETGNRPTEKPHKPNIVLYYGEAFFSGDLLSQRVIDKYWRGFKDNYSWNPYRADIARRDFEDLCVNSLENFAIIERRLRREKIIQRHSRVRAYQLLLRMMHKIGVKPAGYFTKRSKGGVKADCRMLYHLNHFMMDQGDLSRVEGLYLLPVATMASLILRGNSPFQTRGISYKFRRASLNPLQVLLAHLLWKRQVTHQNRSHLSRS
ncbi:hypothetical protein Droror1_Dr00011717 [Drosera rotundifolia]